MAHTVRMVVAAIGVCAVVTAAASPVFAGSAEKCAAARRKAGAKKLKAKMACHGRAKAKNTSVDPSCLTKAETKFATAFAKTSGCPGTAAGIEALVDICVATLVGDVPGIGPCPAASAKACGRAGSCETSCASRDITRPGSLATCHTKCDTKLSAGLAQAGACGQSPTIQADVHACRDSIASSLTPTTTTSTSTTTSSSTSSSTTTSTSTSSTTTTSTSTTSTSTTTLPVATLCCHTTLGMPMCFDAAVPDALVKCPLLFAGATLASPGSVCGAFTGTCGSVKQTGTICCQCPVTSPPFPHPQFCYDTNFGPPACTPPCTIFPGSSACGAFTETCGGSPSGAFL